jgi:hypothetical protein
MQAPYELDKSFHSQKDKNAPLVFPEGQASFFKTEESHFDKIKKPREMAEEVEEFYKNKRETNVYNYKRQLDDLRFVLKDPLLAKDPARFLEIKRLADLDRLIIPEGWSFPIHSHHRLFLSTTQHENFPINLT